MLEQIRSNWQDDIYVLQYGDKNEILQVRVGADTVRYLLSLVDAAEGMAEAAHDADMHPYGPMADCKLCKALAAYNVAKEG
jgi:hypothetical protein